MGRVEMAPRQWSHAWQGSHAKRVDEVARLMAVVARDIIAL